MNHLIRRMIFASFRLKGKLKFNNFIYQPRYYLLQNASRIKSRPKKLEFEVPHIEQQTFKSEANYLFYKLQTSFNKLKEHEPRIINAEFIEDDDQQNFGLKVEIHDLGIYEWKTNVTERLIYYISPVSGIYKYYYDEGHEGWKSNKDKHLHLDLLVREITKNCKGYLDLQLNLSFCLQLTY